MSLVVLENVGLGFGGRELIQGLSLRIDDGERIGVVGPNGSGKTSLFRLIAGALAPDDGVVRMRRNLRIGHLPQDVSITADNTVLRFVLDAAPGRKELTEQVRRAEQKISQLEATRASPTDPEWMEAAEAVAESHQRLADFEQLYSEHEAARILSGLGLEEDQHPRPIRELSGGWKMRVVLASLLFQRPDLLLLDEPTNHLDLPTVAWFGEFLRRSRQGFLLICHDREFLNRHIERVVSFESEGVRQYSGDYEHYRRQRAEEEEILRNKARNVQREREQAQRFIDRFRAKASKAKAVQSRVKALEKMEDVTLPEDQKSVKFRFPATRRSGDVALQIEGVRKAFGPHQVFAGVDLSVRRGEKIAIIGANGAGKTTLLKMVAGELTPDSGEIRLGHNVEAGYYAQHHAETLWADSSIYDQIAELDPGANPTRVRTILGAFMFSDDDADKPIGVLSGGERARVALARLLIRPGNLILMDEPTNHLDLDTSEVLAESLQDFDGTLLFVSHNLSFVRRLADKIWNVEHEHVEVYPGSLDEYLEHCRQREAHTAPETSAEPAAKSVEQKRARKREQAEQRKRRKQVLEPLRDRVRELEQQITELERCQRERSMKLADPALYDDAARRDELLEAFQAASVELQDLMSRWELAQAELESTEQEIR